MATTVSEVRTALYDWINSVVNAGGGSNIPVVFSHQNAPRPGDTYILIHRSPNPRRREGRETTMPANDAGRQVIHSEYEDTWTIEEIDGDGDRLREIVESQDRQDIRNTFAAASLAYRGLASDIQPAHYKLNNEWRYRHIVEIRIGLTSSTEYEPSFIGTVQTTGTIGGKTV